MTAVAHVPQDAQTATPACPWTPDPAQSHTAPDICDLFRSRRRTHKSAWRKR